MTASTEELAKRVGLHWHILKSEEAGQKLQAFREAVEAESDAERMKQKPVMYTNEFLAGAIVSASPDSYWKVPLYREPFPSTEQLQKEVNDLSSKVCDECDGDGWNYNAVEGQVPCVCMTEAEPYQQLQQRVKELEDALHKVAEFCKRESTASRYAFSNRINAEKELTAKLAAFNALASNINKKALANTQGD